MTVFKSLNQIFRKEQMTPRFDIQFEVVVQDCQTWKTKGQLHNSKCLPLNCQQLEVFSMIFPLIFPNLIVVIN